MLGEDPRHGGVAPEDFSAGLTAEQRADETAKDAHDRLERAGRVPAM